MPEDKPHRREGESWHVSKTINLGHLATTGLMLISLFWFVAQQDSRISQAELNIKHLQDSRASDMARTEKKFDEIRSYMLRIESKLDRIIEDERNR